MAYRQQEPQSGLPFNSFDLDAIRTLAYPVSDIILCQHRLSLFWTGIDNSKWRGGGGKKKESKFLKQLSSNQRQMR